MTALLLTSDSTATNYKLVGLENGKSGPSGGSSYLGHYKTSSSAITERPRCKMGQLWPNVEDDILQTL